MTFDRTKFCIAIGVLLSSAAVTAAPVPKQLAGPPGEFAQMRAPDPAASAIHSKSALIPVQMQLDKRGDGTWQTTLPVENGRLRFMLLGTQAPGDWQVTLRDPQGRTLPPQASAKVARASEFGIEGNRYPGEQFTLDNVANGEWTLTLSSGAKSARGGFLLIEGDDATELASYSIHRRHRVGETLGFTAMLTHASDSAIKLGRDAGRIDDAMLQVTAPDGAVSRHPMFDDGKHGDGHAGDGVYGATFVADAAGSYLAQVRVAGRALDGDPLLRTAEHPINVLAPSIALASDKAASRRSSDGRLAIDIAVSHEKKSGHYRALAEVWAHDARGAAVPVAWIGGMVQPERGKVSLGLDERWLARAGALPPYELRQLRIEDPDHFVPLVEADRLALKLPRNAGKAVRASQAIDDEMRMGPRPAEKALAKGVGSRLLLVHGYCSGGVWPTAHFTNASTFLDANQNRSHDQFARLLQSFGSTWNSFGTVAHSQGGAASLHLYTYYWSGLDNAIGSRLIQSVGTPYQGTNLAGILATLGSWFGVGCSSNANLSYSGASAWLAGIPTWARAKVNYYTTSFRTTNWWTNDYCQFATDLVLSDPEDGTTEQAYGQLPGAVNRGHTTGQCHTAGMRDPAQYHDATRNAVMNSNAAR